VEVIRDRAVADIDGVSADAPDPWSTVSALEAECGRLFRVAYLLCGDRGRAEDAVAEAVARVWRRGLSKPIEDIRPYLRRTLVNLLAREHHRRSSEASAMVRHGTQGSEPDAAVDATDHVGVETALLALPVEQRAVVVLRYFEGLSEAEIATTLRIAPGTVKSRAARAIAALRPLLEGD
jgi:RNA polymerase sigma factor (sigma-70 family)